MLFCSDFLTLCSHSPVRRLRTPSSAAILCIVKFKSILNRMLVININHIKADLVTIQDIDIVIVGVSIVDAVIQAFLK